MARSPDSSPYHDQTILVQALRERDEAALAWLFQTTADRLFRLAVSVVHDEASAEDVVQTAFIRLFDAIDGFEGRAEVQTWLYRVVHHEALGRLRGRHDASLDAMLEEDILPPPALIVAWDSLPEQQLCNAEARREMDRAIAKLPPTQRTVFTLRDVEQLSIRQTAEILSMSESAVKVNLHRARLKLREMLSAYFQEIGT